MNNEIEFVVGSTENTIVKKTFSGKIVISCFLDYVSFKSTKARWTNRNIFNLNPWPVGQCIAIIKLEEIEYFLATLTTNMLIATGTDF